MHPFRIKKFLVIGSFAMGAGVAQAGNGAPGNLLLRPASPPPNFVQRLVPGARYKDFQDEMNHRFAAAMDAVVRAPMDAWQDGGLTGLVYLEKDFGLTADATQIISSIIEGGRPLPGLVRENPQGLAESKPVEKKLTWKWFRKQRKMPDDASAQTLAIILAMSAVGHCLPSEAPYNVRFLKHMNSLDWPKDTEWVRMGMIAGFRMHGCISERVLRQEMDLLLPALTRWLRDPAQKTDLKAYVLFALCAAGRYPEIPPEVLLDFVQAQRPDGAWGKGGMEFPAENQAPLGAYVIASMLRAGGYPLPGKDFRLASKMPVRAPPLPPLLSGRNK